MTKTTIHKIYDPIRRIMPSIVADPIRRVATALITPIVFSIRSGHFLSSLRKAAVTSKGLPIPWYTFPTIDFLRFRDFSGSKILEFGGGQSTVWWSKRAEEVVTFEGDRDWLRRIEKDSRSNVRLHLVNYEDPRSCLEEVQHVLKENYFEKFDLIIIDGLYRTELIEVALAHVKTTGAIIADDSEGYGFYEGLKDHGFMRVDFFGHAPGVVLPRCTSIFFRDPCFLFSDQVPVPVIALIEPT